MFLSSDIKQKNLRFDLPLQMRMWDLVSLLCWTDEKTQFLNENY